MIRNLDPVTSQPMYAFDPGTWRQAPGGDFQVDAIWFSRRRDQLVATMGTYHPMVLRANQRPAGGTYTEWIAAADDSRYGGHRIASWDGERLVSTPGLNPVEAATRIAFLTMALDAYPNPPAGYDGWWTFPSRLPRHWPARSQ